MLRTLIFGSCASLAILALAVGCDQQPSEPDSELPGIKFATVADSQITVRLWGQTIGPDGEIFKTTDCEPTAQADSFVVDTIIESDDDSPSDTIGHIDRFERCATLSTSSTESFVGGSYNAWIVVMHDGWEETRLVVQNAPADLTDSLRTVVIDTTKMDLLLKGDTTTHDQCSFEGWTADGAFELHDGIEWRVNLPLAQDTLSFDLKTIRADFFCSDGGDGGDDGSDGGDGGDDGDDGDDCPPHKVIC